MTQDVTPWLLEIKALKQKLGEAQAALEQSYASADHWQKLYEIEANQRRADASLAQQNLESLRDQLQQTQAERPLPVPEDLVQQVANLDMQALQQQLIQVMAQREHLEAELTMERLHHTQTRENLTLALGDAMAVLAKHRLEAMASTDGPNAGMDTGAELES